MQCQRLSGSLCPVPIYVKPLIRLLGTWAQAMTDTVDQGDLPKRRCSFSAEHVDESRAIGLIAERSP